MPLSLLTLDMMLRHRNGVLVLLCRSKSAGTPMAPSLMPILQCYNIPRDHYSLQFTTSRVSMAVAQDSRDGARGSDTVYSMAIPMVVVIVVLFLFSVLREGMKYIIHQRVMTSLLQIQSGQEEYVLDGSEVGVPDLAISSGRWNVIWRDSRSLERITRVVITLDPDSEDQGRAAYLRGRGVDSLGECLIQGRYKAGKDRIAWTQTYLHQADVIIEAWGIVCHDSRGRGVCVNGNLWSSEGNGRRGVFTMRCIAHDDLVTIVHDMMPDTRMRSVPHPAQPRPVPRNRVELLDVEDGVASEETCCICLDECQRGACRLACHHVFHRECIEMWLSNHDDCPTCKHFVREQPAAAAAGRGDVASDERAIDVGSMHGPMSTHGRIERQQLTELFVLALALEQGVQASMSESGRARLRAATLTNSRSAATPASVDRPEAAGEMLPSLRRMGLFNPGLLMTFAGRSRGASASLVLGDMPMNPMSPMSHHSGSSSASHDSLSSSSADYDHHHHHHHHHDASHPRDPTHQV